MNTAPGTRTRTRPPQRWAWWGFIGGAAITMPATFLALAHPIGEEVYPYLAPGTQMLRPIAEVMATWPGLLNMTIAAVVNGVVYAVAAGAVGAVLAQRRPA